MHAYSLPEVLGSHSNYHTPYYNVYRLMYDKKNQEKIKIWILFCVDKEVEF